MDIQSKIILIFGPTASGKSKFAIQLAKRINGEIINADSMQVYKELKILTDRPKNKDLKVVKHHLYGFLNVKKNFSTGQWLKIVQKKIKELKKKNKIPIIVGGTGLYFKSITSGLVKIPKIPANFRNKIRKIQSNLGQEQFYKKLIKIDPNVKNKINSTDVQRSIRAYEVKKFTKKTLTQWFEKTTLPFDDKELLKILIDTKREDLVQKIEKRVNKMIKDGAIKEVKKFLKLRVNKDKSSSKVIGINEISSYLLNKQDLISTKEQIFIKTRQYSKRQSTWARGQMKDWQKVPSQDLTSYIKKFQKYHT